MSSFIKDAATSVMDFPGKVFAKGVGLLLGSKDKKNTVHQNGLLDLIMDGIKDVGRSISSFINDHRRAIAVSIWASLLVSGSVGVALYFLPVGILAAVASFNVYGFSIAGIAGAGALSQVALTAGLAAAFTVSLTFTVAAIHNTIAWIRNANSTTPRNDTAPKGPETSSHGSSMTDLGPKGTHPEKDQKVDNFQSPLIQSDAEVVEVPNDDDLSNSFKPD